MNKKNLFLMGLMMLFFGVINAQEIISWTTASPAVTLQQSTSHVTEGTYSALFNFTSTSNQDYDSESFAVIADATYSFTVDVYDFDAGGRVRQAIVFDDGTTTYSNNYSVDTDGNQTLTLTGTVPSAATTAKVRLRFYDVSADWTGSSDIYADNVAYDDGNGNVVLNSGFESWTSSTDPVAITFNFRGPSWMDNDPSEPQVWGPFASSSWTSETLVYNDLSGWWSAVVMVTPTPAKTDLTYQMRFDQAGTTKYQKATGDFLLDATFTTTTGEIWIDASDNASFTWNADEFYLLADKITETEPIQSVAETTTLPYTEEFTTGFGQCKTYSVSGANEWTYDGINGLVNMNGWNTGGLEEDWLILPGIMLTNYTNEVMTFQSWNKFGNADDVDNYFQLLFSTDYSGIGDPTSATWNELSFTSPSAAETWTASGDVDLSWILEPTKASTVVYIAFKSHYNVDNYKSWSIDQINIEESSTGIQKLDSKVAVYPNPTTGLVQISSENTISKVEVYNITGQKLTSISSIEGSEISISEYAAGVYFLKVYDTQNSVQTLRLVKK